MLKIIYCKIVFQAIFFLMFATPIFSQELTIDSLIFKKNKLSRATKVKEIKKDMEKVQHVYDYPLQVEYKDSTFFTEDLPLDYILELIDSVSIKAYQLELITYWMSHRIDIIILPLLKRVSDNKFVGLAKDSQIWVGEPPKYDIGETTDILYFVSDDLERVAGRANYFLKIFTNEDYGNITFKTSKEELLSIQKKWVLFFSKKAK